MAILPNALPPDVQRALAKGERKFIEHVRNKQLDQSVSMSAWLVASLLVINGGGCLTTLKYAGQMSNPIRPASWFIAGVVLALFAGFLVQSLGRLLLGGMNEIIAYWISVETHGERDEEIEQKNTRKAVRGATIAMVAPITGLISGATFLIGCISFAQTFSPDKL